MSAAASPPARIRALSTQVIGATQPSGTKLDVVVA
jgi:hypothetical protein